MGSESPLLQAAHQQPKRRRVPLPGTVEVPCEVPTAVLSGSASAGPPMPRPGCRQCVACANGLTYARGALVRSGFKSAEWKEWWPAGLHSPTVYFHLRAKQLRSLLRSGHSCADELWRPVEQCQYAGCRLLRRRGTAPLALHVPLAQTGIEAPEEARFVGSVVVLLRQPGTSAAGTLPQLTAAALEAHSRSQAAAPTAPAHAAPAAAKLQWAAQLAAVAAALPGPGLRRVDCCFPQLSPAGSCLSLASSSGFSFSGLSLRSSPSPSSPSDHASPPPALPPRPPLEHSKPCALRELAVPAGLQRIDCANPHWQLQLQFLRQQVEREQAAPWRGACSTAPLPC